MNILELLSSRGLHPRQVSANKGGEYACACPGCGGADKPGNPSDRFHAFPNQEGGPLCQEASAPGTYWCRKCGAGGDLLQYLIDFEHMSFAAACAELGAKLPTNLPVRGRLPLPPKITEAPAFVPTVLALPSTTWRERAARLVEKSHARLLETPNALRWLAKRGLDLDAVRKYRLGYLAEEPNRNNRPGIFRARNAWGLPDKEVKNQDGTLAVKKQMFIPRGIVIPAYGPEGYHDGALPIRIRIRRPDEDIKGTDYPKYHVIPGSCMAPLLLGASARAFVVVEAELDAMLVHYLAGDSPTCKVGALAVLTNLGKPDADAYAALIRALTVLVALDYDKAGANGWAWWREHCATARRWPVPAGKDPGDAFKLGEDLRAWALAGLPQVLRLAAPAPVSAPLGVSVSGEASATGEGAQASQAAQGAPQPAPESTAPAMPAPVLPVATPRQYMALWNLARFMERKGVTYGPDSTGFRAWLYPAGLSLAERDELFGDLLPLAPSDLYAMIQLHPEPVVTAANLCAPYQPQRRNL